MGGEGGLCRMIYDGMSWQEYESDVPLDSGIFMISIEHFKKCRTILFCWW